MANKNTHAAKPNNLRTYVLLCMFVAIVFLLGMTPIGMIPLPFMKATTVHIPVIIGSILLGPRKGAILGLTFGLVSFINSITAPTALAFCFNPMYPVPGTDRGSGWALLICFGARAMVGVVPWFVYKGARMLIRKDNSGIRTGELAVAGFLGSMTNTVLVMGFIGLFLSDGFAALNNVSSTAVAGIIMGIVASNGIPEAIVAAILTSVICLPLQKLMKQDVLPKAEKPVPAEGAA